VFRGPYNGNTILNYANNTIKMTYFDVVIPSYKHSSCMIE
jgi:hypothetical protein